MSELVEVVQEGTLLVDAAANQLAQTSVEQQLVIQEAGTDLVEVDGGQTVLVETAVVQLLTDATQGPPGPTGTAEEEVPYAKRVDFASDTVIYRGEAQPGAVDGDQVWRIRRLTLAVDGDVQEQWAGGTAEFNKRWTERAALTYI